MEQDTFEKLVTDKNKALTEGIAAAIRGALKQRGWPIQLLATKTGIARQTLSLLLASTEGHSWTQNHLVRITTVLGVSLAELIASVEKGELLPKLMVDTEGTLPHSKERLTRIIQAIAAKGTSKDVLDLYFTAEMMAISAPEYTKNYFEGMVDDRNVYELLFRINENLGPEENLWGKLAAALAEKEA